MFEIHLGIPEMEELWNDLQKKHHDGTATKKEEKLRRQMGKAIFLTLARMISGCSKTVSRYFTKASSIYSLDKRIIIHPPFRHVGLPRPPGDPEQLPNILLWLFRSS